MRQSLFKKKKAKDEQRSRNAKCFLTLHDHLLKTALCLSIASCTGGGPDCSRELRGALTTGNLRASLTGSSPHLQSSWGRPPSASRHLTLACVPILSKQEIRIATITEKGDTDQHLTVSYSPWLENINLKHKLSKDFGTKIKEVLKIPSRAAAQI